MTAILAFLGLRGTVVAGILSALLLAVSGLAAYQYVRAEAAVIAERAAKADKRDAEAATRDAEADLQTCLQANESAAALETARAKVAEENAKAQRAALDRARAAVAKAEREKAVLDRAMDQWREAWGQRSPTCTAALTALDGACPDIRRY